MDIYIVYGEHEPRRPLEEAVLNGVADGRYDVSGVMPYTGAKGAIEIVFWNRKLDLFKEYCSSLDGFRAEGPLKGRELEARLDIIFEDAGGEGGDCDRGESMERSGRAAHAGGRRGSV